MTGGGIGQYTYDDNTLILKIKQTTKCVCMRAYFIIVFIIVFSEGVVLCCQRKGLSYISLVAKRGVRAPPGQINGTNFFRLRILCGN